MRNSETENDISEEIQETRKRLHHAQADLDDLLEQFGDALAVREDYREHDGADAIRFYLLQRHGWLPREVLKMSFEELRFAVSEEMVGWRIGNPAPPRK